MFDLTATPEELLDTAIAVLERRDGILEALDELPAAIYVTNAEGVLTYFNAACIDFSGRTPRIGHDLWCVTWKLYSDDGQFLPHDKCPMAETIQTKRKVRGMTAIAERPDGTRVRFMPYPTPILGREGELLGAVNMLMDVTDPRNIVFLRSQAKRCRRLALLTSDGQAADTLIRMASEYEEKAREFERPQ